jgi:hypothetical protein
MSRPTGPVTNGLSPQQNLKGQTVMNMLPPPRQGIAKYFIAWLLGVPVTLLIIIFIIARGC